MRYLVRTRRSGGVVLPGGQGGGLQPNPSALPLATSQALASTAYTALNVPSQAAGWSYADPTTNVKVFKVTDASTPVTNTTAIPCYFESGPRISHRWGTGKYTLDIYLPDASAHYFVDFDYAAETFSNWRSAPTGTNEVGRGFSLKAATPQIYFLIQGGTLRKYDLSSGSNVEVTTGGFPKDLSAHLGGGSRFEWLGFGIDERWFVMMSSNKARMVAYNAVTDTVLVKTSTDAGFGLDEPKMERNGRYVWVRSDDARARWWDLDSDTFGAISADSANNYKGHAGTPRGYAAGTQADAETAQWYAAPMSADPIVVNAADSVVSDLGAAGHWVTQSPVDETQYVLITSNDAGDYGGGPVLLQRAIGLFRMNGTDRRLLCQHFSMGNSHTDAYYRGPAWGNISPDGLLVLFKSSMLSTTGRADSFLAKVPTL